jgi:hypothetical protein
MGPGEFDEIHSLELDSRGWLFVADRQNNRIQVFDAEGNFIDQWFQFGRPSGIHIDENDVIYVADSESRDARTNIGRPLMDRRYNPGTRRGHTDRKRAGRIRASLHTRSMHLSLSGDLQYGGRRNGRCRWQRVRRGVAWDGQEIRETIARL